MKNVFLLLLAVSLFSVSCKKNEGCAYTQSQLMASSAEKTYLRNYMSANSITAVEDTSGVFYTINSQGTGANPTICSSITVKYAGTIIPTGAPFDASTSPSGVTFSLGQLIVGWQKVLPVLKKGGTITLYIPPSLGYGPQNVRNANGDIVIPGNSYLKFNIELLGVE